MSKIHSIKTWKRFFDLVWQDKKTFELRKNDRGYEVGDGVELEEYIETYNTYTGRVILAEVIYMLNDDFAGLDDGFCIMQIKVLWKGEKGGEKG